MATAGVGRKIPTLYGALLASVSAGNRAGATQTTAALLAEGEPVERVYRTIVRTLLARGIGSAPGATPLHGLWALNAALFLTESLSPAERASALAQAAGAAVGDAPARPPVPFALPGVAGALPIHTPHGADLANRVRAAALAGDEAGAEWALAALLVGEDRGSQPSAEARRAAYGALFAATAQAETSTRGWGHLLVGAHHAVEMAELLPASQTLLALRPAIWALARRHLVAPPASPDGDVLPPAQRCALRLNRRQARAGETAQWARTLRLRPVARVVEEALASGLARDALLDGAMLAATQIVAAATKGAATSVADGRHRMRGLSALAAHTVLALHAARRAHDLAPPADDTLAAALRLLERLAVHARAVRPVFAPATPTLSAAELARAVAPLADVHALAVAEAIFAEQSDAQSRASDFVAALTGQAELWVSALASAEREPGWAIAFG